MCLLRGAVPIAALSVFALGLLSGCGESESEVQVYESPKHSQRGDDAASEPTAASVPSPRTMQIPPGMNLEAAPAIDFSIPSDWTLGEERPGRLATFNAAGPDDTQSEITVTGFRAGMPLPMNIQRWRGQIDLGPPPPGDRGATLMEGMVDGQRAITVIMRNPDNAKTLSVTIARFGDFDYFFKLWGDSAAVQAQTPAFARFVDSVRFPQDG
ncbi:MAG: hypothetical protein ACFB20_02610 [Opitutales bacterium]